MAKPPPCAHSFFCEMTDDPTNCKGSIEAPAEQEIPLQEWLECEGCRTASDVNDLLNLQRASLLRKITVAFAIGRLIQHLEPSIASSHSQDELFHMCSVDNFTVLRTSADEVVGVEMISPSVLLNITSNSYDKEKFFTNDSNKHWGRDVKTIITRHSPFCCAKKTNEDNERMHNKTSISYAFGVLLEYIFSGEISADSIGNPQEMHSHVGELLRSLSISPLRMHLDFKECASNHASDEFEMEKLARQSKHVCTSSQKNDSLLMLPGQLCCVVSDLLGCKTGEGGDHSETSALLDAVLDDMHMLLLRPNQLLFGINHQLNVTTEMYGRTFEAKTLTDAFCRVSLSGHSEAFTVTGFSG